MDETEKDLKEYHHWFEEAKDSYQKKFEERYTEKDWKKKMEGNKEACKFHAETAKMFKSKSEAHWY